MPPGNGRIAVVNYIGQGDRPPAFLRYRPTQL